MSVRKVRDAVVVMIAFLVLIWTLQVFNWADGYGLDTHFGIWPRHVTSLADVFTAPFLHFSWQHLEGNSVPLLVLGFLAAYRGIAKFLMVTVVVALTSGIGVWLFQNGGELTVGASGLIFGYFGYVLLRGIFDRNLLDIGVGIVAGLLYWTILQVAIPGTPGISWIGHLTGLLGGVAAAWMLRSPSAPLPRWRPASAARPATNGPDGTASASGAADSPGAGGAARDGQARPLGSTAADELLRKIDELGI